MKFRTLSYFLTLCMLLSLCSCSNGEAAIDDGGAITNGAIADSAAGGDKRGDSYRSSDSYSGESAAAGDTDDFEYSEEYAFEGVYEEAATDSFSASDVTSEICADGDYDYSYIQPQAGLLTGGEWNDNENFDFWKDLINQRQEWSSINSRWELYTLERIAVTTVCDNAPAGNIRVKLISGNTIMWEAVTDNEGKTYLFSSLSPNNQYRPTKIIAEQNGKTLAEMEYTDGDSVELKLSSVQREAPALDLMFVIDTTGSMSDELYYIQTELSDIVKRVADNNQIDVRLSVNFYRDTQDEYTVRSYPFTTDIREAVAAINTQDANGGGDYEEAVEQALDDAINNHDWSDGNIKLIFLVLDAPPHYTSENARKLSELLEQASAEGIRIIPVASSGVDTETEFLCRTFSIATGGTYTFLTNHSGIGGDHLEPTVGYYQVERLNDMIVRIIESYL